MTAKTTPPLRGALVTLDSSGTALGVPFQFNPANMTRTLTPQTIGGGPGERSDAVLFIGAPVETIQLTLDLDAYDNPSQQASPQLGIAPALAALEVMTYPSVQDIQNNARQLAQGTLEVGPFVAPTTLLVWGEQRVVPVAIQRFTITEQEYDHNLNPVRAQVQCQLRVLTFTDVSSTSKAYQVYMAYQSSLESLANVGRLQGSAKIQSATGAKVGG